MAHDTAHAEFVEVQSGSSYVRSLTAHMVRQAHHERGGGLLTLILSLSKGVSGRGGGTPTAVGELPQGSRPFGEEHAHNLPGDALGIQLQPAPLSGRRAVLNEGVRHTDAVDGRVLHPGLRKGFQDG